MVRLILIVAAFASGAGAQRLIELPLDDADERLQWARSSWSTRAEWRVRAHEVRTSISEQLDLPCFDEGRLGPRADRGELRAMVTDVRDYGDYIVEDVVFESFPGTHVAGNLYRPADARGRHPAVLCPHGHFSARDDDPEGRFRRDMQTRCATLARMGAVVFAWDMVGWGESDIADHHDPAALPLQTYNSIRVVDYLLSRPEVDADRIAVTGASGGGSQSFLLAALDDRVDACIPVVMVSAHFFGGCECETGLPIHAATDTTNVEIAAMAAPRPVLVVSCGGDWTRRTPEVEAPFIREVYETLGVGERFAAAHFADEGHDYGASKRAAMYEFLATHFELDLDRVRVGVLFDEYTSFEPREVLCAVEGEASKRSAAEALAALRGR